MVVIFTGGKSTAINSPRHLTIRHARRTVFRTKLALGLASAEDDDEPDLAPGEERLNSFWAPALVAGPVYEITATQTVNAPSNDPLLLVSNQDFTVDAPQFSLPEGSIYSTYPPPAYPDDHRILPHVVLSDPHLPWERIGSPSTEKAPDNRNKVPWLVLLSFTQDELKLQPGSLGSLDFKQTATLSIRMTVEDLQKLDNVATPSYKDVGDAASKTGEFVFIKPDLFKNLFSKFDDENNREDAKTPFTQNYKFLSHVRKINTTGMAVAGTEEVGIFSVVVSGRAGPMHNKVPASVAVHLLSIEGVEDMDFPGTDKDFVSLCSLHSWNYTVMPPGMLNVFDAFTALGKTLNVLRPPDEIINSLEKGTDRVRNRVATRLKDGYSLVKYRLQTGEQTVALCRGPFTPSIVLRFDQFNKCSNSGQDLQILDQEIGLMDVTYSSAWQLGRVLAAGDQSFTAALSRFRSAIHTAAIKASKEEVIIQAGTRQSFRSRTDVLGDLKGTVEKLDQIHRPQQSVGDGDGGGGNDGDVDGDENEPTHLIIPDSRWYRRPLKRKEYPHLGLDQDVVGDKYLTFAIQAALDLSMAKNGEIYDETNAPVSTDWMVILAWVMDRMFLAGVPAHYLLTDPSHLGPESLRFFHIDLNWVDALIDGALSLGNHQGTDKDREAIKHAINRYVEYLPPTQPHRPQIPTYGFYLRSDLVTMFPDLKVTTLPEPPEGTRPERAPLLRHEIVADGVMLGLFDRVPGSHDFTGLNFTQPPHQQRFAAADSLSAERATISIRKQYTVSREERKNDPTPHTPLEEIEVHPGDPDNWFIWDSKPKSSSARAGESDDDDDDDDLGPENDLRVLRLPRFADGQLATLQEKMGTFVDGEGHDKKFFDDDTATSALLAMQLIDPIYYLQINLEGNAALKALQPSVAGEAESSPGTKLRKLQLVKHTVVPNLTQSSGNGNDDGDDGSEVIAQSSHTIAYRTKPASLTHVPSNAPHVRPMVTETLEQAMSSPHPHGVPIPDLENLSTTFDIVQDPAGAPIFQCNVYTLQDRVVMLDKDGMKQDLVFSVIVANNELSDYQLMEFDIAVPLGPTTDQTGNRLMETYDGPGATMLSNLRFNVLTSFTTIPDLGLRCLLLRLVPRSSKGYVGIEGVHELGFILSLAKINEYATDQRLVTLYTSAYYKDKHETDPRKDQFTVVIQKHAQG
ncbi:hypothetical protein F4781DRAFT_409984 [Annulohypoxylon bovei var. microspora]|nr:hypothetical protein F4781DRAFT_409984 [Annulohypoxylon bovei var. microspora]